MTPTISPSSAWSTVHAMAEAAAAAIALRRPIVVHPDGERAVHVHEVDWLPFDRMRASFDPVKKGDTEGCYRVQLMGVEAEVWFRR